MTPHQAQPNPTFYDDLEATSRQAWALLAQGASDRHSPVHTPAIATVGLDGRPRVRTVVLRGADPKTRQLRFHTDARANKIAELARNSAIELVAYDAGNKTQLRIVGQAKAHHGDDIARNAWTASQWQSQLCYRQAQSPGSPSDDPVAATAPGATDGSENFVAVVIDVDAIEWLYLAASGHRRARFSWPNGELVAKWLAP